MVSSGKTTRRSMVSVWAFLLAIMGTVSADIFFDSAIMGPSQAWGAYCSGSGGCDEYIYGVQVGSINNIGTTCSNYADYTSSHSTTMEAGNSYAIDVITAIVGGNSYTGYNGDECGIWIDWNQDDDFYDPNELVYSAQGVGLFSTTITPPADALPGDTRMRIRLRWTGAGGTLQPCNATSYGEVEDYTITIPSTGPATRIYGKKWHDSNDNGVIDPNEPGLSGWTIFLDENRNGIVDPNDISTTTNAQGDYELTGMDPNIYYYISEANQNGWINTYPGAGGMHSRILVEENIDVELNFGNYQLHNGDINGYKFHDVNNNGVWDNGENPLSGWEIYIDENENSQWDSGEPKTITNASGYYEFTNLTPGYYNIMEVPQTDWLQTYPGPTSGRLWGLEGRGSQWSTIAELNLDTTTIENRFEAPYNSTILSGGCLAAGPSTLFNCALKLTSATTAESLVFEIDSETGLVIDQGVLEMPVNEIAWDSTWHNGILHVASVVVPFPPAPQLPDTYLNRYDAITKELISRDQVLDISFDGFASDPYEDLLLCNMFVAFSVYEIDPLTANIVGSVSQQIVPAPEMTYTNGVLYKIFWGSSRNDLYAMHREDGSVISITPIPNYEGFDVLAGGIGVKGGHRVWIGKKDVTANFGNRLDSEATLSGIKYEDVNGNGVRDNGEPGLEGWKIYLDLNQNEQLDPSEPSDITDENGNYQIENLSSGLYTVAEVSQCRWIPTAPLSVDQQLISVTQPHDLVFDSQRNMLYISAANGNIVRFDLEENGLLSPWNVGTSVNGMDITPDNSTLYVTEQTTDAVQRLNSIHKVNLDSQNVTNVTYSSEDNTGGNYDIKIGSQEKGLICPYGGGYAPLLEIDLTDDSVSLRPDVPGSYLGDKIESESRIVRGFDRTLLVIMEKYGGDGDIIYYDAFNDTFAYQYPLDNRSHDTLFAINRDASHVSYRDVDNSYYELESLHVRTADFIPVTALDYAGGGTIFDVVRNILYRVDSENDLLIAVDMESWEELFRVKIDEDVIDFSGFSRGMMAVSEDGRFLALTTTSGVRLFRMDHFYQTQAIAGRTLDSLDFGNQKYVDGDFDDDRDVDTVDFSILSEQWLLEKLSADIAPNCPDGVVNLLDWTIFANAWQSTANPLSANWNPKCDMAPLGGDGIVGIDDLLVFASQWLQLSALEADIAPSPNGDGFVNMLDFAAFTENWLYGTEVFLTFDEDFETGDFSKYPWTFGGDGLWSIDTGEVFEGSFSATSGEVIHDYPILKLTLNVEAGDIKFLCKVGDYTDAYLAFYIDGELYGTWYERQDWALQSIPVLAGVHVFEWKFVNYSNSMASSAWIDGIILPQIIE